MCGFAHRRPGAPCGSLRGVRFLAAAAALMIACSSRAPEPAQTPASPPTSSPASPTASSPPSPPTSSPTSSPVIPVIPVIHEAVALEPAGPAKLSLAQETVVDPAATFRVEVAHALADARLVLLDGAQAILAARGTREVGATGTVFTLAPGAPLVPASRYALRLEGLASREMHDAAGRAYAPVSAPILAAGSPPPPEPKQKPKPKRSAR